MAAWGREAGKVSGTRIRRAQESARSVRVVIAANEFDFGMRMKERGRAGERENTWRLTLGQGDLARPPHPGLVEKTRVGNLRGIEIERCRRHLNQKARRHKDREQLKESR